MKSIHRKKFAALPEKVKIVNKTYVMCAACRLEPGVKYLTIWKSGHCHNQPWGWAGDTDLVVKVF